MIFKLSDNQPIDTMKADYCVVVWAVNLSEQTLFDLPLRHFDLTNDLCLTVIISSEYGRKFLVTLPTYMELHLESSMYGQLDKPNF